MPHHQYIPDLMSMDRALALIKENKKNQSPSLDLSNLSLTGLPDELWDLTHLKKLSLGGDLFQFLNLRKPTIVSLRNGIRGKDLTKIRKLVQLSELNLCSNQIQDVSTLSSLKQLKKLDLSDNQIRDISTLSSLKNLSDLDLSMNKIQDISALSSLKKLEKLNLYDNQIQDLSPICGLRYLSDLNVENNQIQDITALSTLKQLESLDLTGNIILDFSILDRLPMLSKLSLGEVQIRETSFLSRLKQLSYLDLSFNQIQDFSFLSDLTQLTKLRLIHNEIQDINFLSKLLQVTSLELSHNQIQDISPLGRFNQLSELILNENQIQDISALSRLSKLTKLNLHTNQIRDISALSGLKNLTNLDLGRNLIEDISPLSNLPRLSELYLIRNQIKDISALSSLKKLSKLHLDKNQIQDTSFFKCPPKLSKLALSYNQIQNFPRFLLLNKNLRSLYLFNNPIVDFPKELLGFHNFHDCLDDAHSWFSDLDKGRVENHELKLILIGNGRVGKSSIVDGIMGKEYNPQKDPTHAIHIAEWQPHGTDKPMKVNIWDFGGQDIYHGIHRLFLQSRALYLVVWDEENETRVVYTLPLEGRNTMSRRYPLSYWLDYVNWLSQDSPIIVVQNKVDIHEEVPPGKHLGNNHNYNIQFYRAVSAKERGFRFEYLYQTLIEVLSEMPEYGQMMPQSWHQVREEVKNLSTHKEFLEHDEYLSICKNYGVSRTATSLLNFLHHTGVVFYRQGIFKNRIILDQLWAIQSVYSLLNWQEEHFRHIEAGKGWFNMGVLEQVWEDFSAIERQVMISYMESCDLCFMINDSIEDPQFVIPQMLPSSPERNVKEIWEGRYSNSLHYLYSVRFLHEAIIHRFIARAGRLAEPLGLWSRGISLKYKSAYALVEVTNENDIHIWIDGPQRKDLLSRICNVLNELLRDIKQIEQFVGIGHDQMSRLEEAKKYRNKEEVATVKGGFMKTRLLQDFFFLDEDAKLEEIVPDAPKKPAVNLYLSWSESENDRLIKDSFEKSLAIYRHQGKMKIWDVTQILPGMDVKDSKEKAQKQADIFSVLLSPDYNNSLQCLREMEKLLEQSKNKSIKLIPIYGRPCQFEDSQIGNLQLLPRSGKAVSQYERQEEVWKEIAGEFKKILESESF